MKSLSLYELLEQFKSGNHSAFEYIYMEYADKVYRFAKRYINNSEDAEEVVQDVFIRLWDARSFINPQLNFDNYLFTITKNLIFNRHRSKVNETYFKTMVLSGLEQEHHIPENEIIAKDLSQYIDNITEKLPPKQQKIFNLSRKQFFTHKEIASQMGISEKTVEAHIYQALRNIRKFMESESKK